MGSCFAVYLLRLLDEGADIYTYTRYKTAANGRISPKSH